ncbi:hypothetical protein [Flavobacterium sp. CS20]|uniref:hypothetical protein n=1 Tax=Flavobacterium sp. CS20 TaxID=2775246 RepID=UPI001B3A723C|nr:hypothetical protein [Flavobacterium sp. CS20]QTY27901.1 hypothetical protein IGB25_05175 [Flavobacterium sp. CS20]
MKKKDGSDIGGIVCGGFMFLGVGIGWLLQQNFVMTGAIGLGVGLIAMATIMVYYKKNNNDSE